MSLAEICDRSILASTRLHYKAAREAVIHLVGTLIETSDFVSPQSSRSLDAMSGRLIQLLTSQLSV